MARGKPDRTAERESRGSGSEGGHPPALVSGSRDCVQGTPCRPTSGLDGVWHLQVVEWASDAGLPKESLETAPPRQPPPAPSPRPPSSGRVCRVASAGGTQSLRWWAGVGEGAQGPLPGFGLGVPTVTQGAGLEGSPTVSRGLFWGSVPRLHLDSPQPSQQVTSLGSGVPWKDQAGPPEGPA